MRKLSKTEKIIAYGILAFFAAFSIYPILVVFSISIRPGDRLLSKSLAIIPPDFTFQTYVDLFLHHPFLRWMGNSLIVSVLVTVFAVTLAATAGYAFSRYKFRGRGASMIAIITTQMFPVTMLLLPLFIMLIKIGAYDSYVGLIIAYSATALPFTVWQMKGYYDTIPYSLEEAATIDGAGQFTEITHEAGLASSRSGKGATFGDIDLDGDLDLVVPYFSLRNRIYRNKGTDEKTNLVYFEDVTDDWLPSGSDSSAKSASATLADVDNDGDLDLYFANLVFSNRLYENDGTGKFTDITMESGLLDSSLSHSGCFFDADNSGKLDLYISNRGRNIFYKNRN